MVIFIYLRYSIMILRVIKGYLSFLREWMLAGPLHSTCLVIVCVRFSLSLLEALCVVFCWWLCAPAAALSATHSFLGPMTCFTYLPPCFFHDAINWCLFATFVSIFFHISLSGINLCLFTFQYRIALATIQKKKKRERESRPNRATLLFDFSLV